MKSVFSTFSSCRVLQSRFYYHCRQMMSTPKLNIRDFFYSMLGCTAISKIIEKNAGEYFDAARAAEEAFAYSLLNKIVIGSNENIIARRDTALWRLADFKDICSDCAWSKPISLSNVDDVDKCFRNEPARQA